MHDTITIKGARLHNLKNVTLSIPKNKLVVFTGLSGSGKSTLAIDTLHTEGQRQFIESLGLVTFGMSKPPMDGIEGLSPSISIDQHLTNRSPRSTVGTATEVFTYIRVLYARIGHRPCPNCGRDVPPSYDVDGADVLDDESGNNMTAEGAPGDESDAGEYFPCPHCGAPIPEMTMANFSFNKPAGACPTCTGLGVTHGAKLELVVNPERSVLEDGVLIWERVQTERYAGILRDAGRYYGFTFDPNQPIKKLGDAARDLLLYGVASPQFKRHYPDRKPPETVRQGYFEGVVTSLLRRYAERIQDTNYRENMEKLILIQVCPDCNGDRLKPASRQVTVAGQTIVDLARMPFVDLSNWLDRLPDVVTRDELLFTEPVVADLRERVRRLIDVGVGYLSMERSSPTVSAGEAQRLRLAALLGSGLTGVLYVLDEPTIGLHARDTGRLIQTLRRLRDQGNTVLVIEHDLDMVRAADYVVDVGPGAGKHGGEIVVAGPPETVAAYPDSTTGGYLLGRLSVPVPERRRLNVGGDVTNVGPNVKNGHALTICEAREHNLKNITVKLPLGTFVAVTGVSGSGKSSLMFDILDRAARQRFYGASEPPGKHAGIEGWEHIDKIITIDQSALARVPRSNAATYTDAFTPIREAFAATSAARERGLTPGRFSFNVPGGRCERCQGAGVLNVEMHFLPDVQVRCPACRGRRFKREVLAVQYHGNDIASVLNMTIEEALALFQEVPPVVARLELMVEVGLGYLQLGQPATTLSGGEAQRVKLAKELGRRATGRTLYLLDEPTTGLHPADTARLLTVLQRLVDTGNTVVVVEHNLDVIQSADWIIDLGPEGGVAGGEIIAEGTPEEVAQVPASSTGQFLRARLRIPPAPLSKGGWGD